MHSSIHYTQQQPISSRITSDRKWAERAFAHWLQSNGLRVPVRAKFALKRSVTDDYELVAADNIEAGEQILSMPLSLTLALDPTPEQSALPVEFADLTPIIDAIPKDAAPLWQLPLALRLLSERVKPTLSFFEPCIQLLPVVHPFVPIFFNRDQISQLQYAPLIQQINKRAKLLHSLPPIIQTQRSKGCDPFNAEQIDASTIGWSLATVTSRAFALHHDLPHLTRRMLPLIDMANHSFDPSASISFGESQRLELTAVKSIQRGEPITLSYGALNNDNLLLNYGFVVDDNPHEDLTLSFHFDSLDAACSALTSVTPIATSSWHRELIQQLKPEQPLIISRTNIDSRLQTALRILLTDNKQSSYVSNISSADDPYFVAASHPERPETFDRSVTEATEAWLDMILATFPTSLTDDLKALAASAEAAATTGGSDLTVEDVCIRFRIAKKRLLLDAQQRLKSTGSVKQTNNQPIT